MIEKQSQKTKPKGGARPGSGRPKGVPNRVSRDAREAIAQVLQKNAPNLDVWLQSVAEGEKEFEPTLDDAGQPLMEKGKPVGDWNWLRRPDPATALKLWADLGEFSFPKLARTELTGPKGEALALTVKFVNARNTG